MHVEARRSGAARRLAAAALAVVVVLSLGIGPTDAAKRYRVDTATRRDWVGQANFVQCVGASMQMMLNMIEPGRDRSPRTQRRLQNLAREYSGPRLGGGERRGASIRGWVAGLRMEGGGPYRIVGADTLREAMQLAAHAIDTTGRPVGLLVWSGRHAWVMSGFEATGDPQLGGRVTRAIIHDPLFPHGSGLWGPSPRPGEAITLQQVGRQFVRRSFSPWAGSLGGQYVLVVPYHPDTRRASAA